MKTDAAALAVTFADRGSSSPDDVNAQPPEAEPPEAEPPEAEPPAAEPPAAEAEPPADQPADQPRRRRRWFNRLPGGAFLDGPTEGRYSNLWLGACGQGG